jgi:hypothetical protein
VKPGVAAVIALGAILAMLVTAALLASSSTSARPSLADKINSACRPGYRMQDWSFSSEFNPMPADVVQETCGTLCTADNYNKAESR